MFKLLYLTKFTYNIQLICNVQIKGDIIMQKLKKIVSIMLLFVLILGVYGCGSKSPSNVVKTYFEELKKGTNGDFAKMLDNSLRIIITFILLQAQKC